jgi:hypothetical protein
MALSRCQYRKCEALHRVGLPLLTSGERLPPVAPRSRTGCLPPQHHLVDEGSDILVATLLQPLVRSHEATRQM